MEFPYSSSITNLSMKFWNGLDIQFLTREPLLACFMEAEYFQKFDIKSRFWQIQIQEDKYKTTFAIPFGHYESNVMSFGLKNAPSEFPNIMNDIFNDHYNFSLVYNNDVLIFSQTIDQHFKHLDTFLHVVKNNGLAILAHKIKLFQTKIRFLGHEIVKGTIKLIARAFEF